MPLDASQVKWDAAPLDHSAIVWDDDAAKKKPSTLVDALKSFGSGALQNLNTFLTDNPHGLSEADPQYQRGTIPAAAMPVAVPGSDYKPQSDVGHYAQTAGMFAPGMLGGPESLMLRALTRVVAPMAGGEAAGAMTAGTKAEPYARALGMVLGGAAPSAAGAAGQAGKAALLSKIAEPLGPEEAALVQQYEQMGGHLRPGQYNPSQFMRQGDAVVSDTAWPRASGFKADSQTYAPPSQQADEYNRLLSRSFGEDAPRITDSVVSDARARIGDVYKQVLPRNTVRMDEPLATSMADIDNRISEAFPAMDPADANRISGVMNRIRVQLDQEGGLPGKLYQNYRERGGLLDELSGSGSPVLQRAAKDMRGAFDDAFARQAMGEDGAALQQARSQYRALSTLEPLVNKAPTGNVSPGQVLGAVLKEYGSPANAGDLGTLARVGSAFLKSTPSSGTAERTVWRNMINKPISGTVGAMDSAVSLPISLIAGRALNSQINSPEMRARLLKALQEANKQP